MNSNDCDFNLSLEKRLYWVNAINKYQASGDVHNLFLELVTISTNFHLELINFLRFILANSWDNPGKLCFINILKTGFQACTCFNNDKPEEIEEDLGFLFFIENEFMFYWTFTSEEFKEFLFTFESILLLN